jgi:hypothetical protein
MGILRPALCAVLLLVGCGGGQGGSVTGGPAVPCDPLVSPPVMLGTVLGVGEDSLSTFYVADEVADGGGQNRVFVSQGDTLKRQHVLGTGSSGGPPNADYTFSFQAPFADASTARALLIQVRGGAVTAMGLGPSASRQFYAPDAGDEPLTVEDAGVVASFKIQNLPALIEYVADVSNGDSIVVTEPMDPSGYSGFRLFYGAPGEMIERAITNYDRGDYGDDISFTVEATTYTAHLAFAPFGLDGGNGPFNPGPSTLDTGAGGKLSITQRMPPPSSLSGFSFTCLGS